MAQEEIGCRSPDGAGRARPGARDGAYGLAREPITALAAGAIAGTSWIGALATLSVSAQVALPDWVRARGLALYTTVFFGCLTLGSAASGGAAVLVGLANAHFLAAAGAVAAIA